MVSRSWTSRGASAGWKPVDSPRVEAVASTAETAVGDRVYRRSATGGGDAKQVRNAGVSTVEFAFGRGTPHDVDEYTAVAGFVNNVVVGARLLEAPGA